MSSQNEIPEVLLEWQDIYYVLLNMPLEDKQNVFQDKVILNGVSGWAKPKEFTAIMGASGAGKTTLLDVLSGRQLKRPQNAVLDGVIKVNGHTVGTKESAFDFKNISSYVMQDDELMPTLTVRESLLFSARLRLAIDEQAKEAKVDKLIESVQLTECKDTVVGFGQGISGGQKKRTCLAIELLTDPSVLFLDEPTSGLDAYTAFVVVNLIKEQTKINRTIITTIHQPSSRVVSQFDNLILMTQGKIVFQGHPYDCPKFFESIGVEFPSNVNIASRAINILHIRNLKKLEESEEILFNKLMARYQVPSHNCSYKQLDVAELKQMKPKHTLAYEFKMCLGRNLKDAIRNPELLQTRFMMALFIVISNLMMVTVIDDESSEAVWTLYGFFFIHIAMLYAINLDYICQTFPRQRTLLFREYANNMYSIPTYYLTKVAIDLPMLTMFAVFITVGNYYPIGLRGGLSHFFQFLLPTFMVSMFAEGWGSVLSWNIQNANIVTTSYMQLSAPWFIFAGFAKNLNTMMPYHYPIFYANVSFLIQAMSYIYAAICLNEWDDRVMECQMQGECAPLDDLGFEDWEYWVCIAMIFGICSIMYTIGLFGIFRMVKKNVQK